MELAGIGIHSTHSCRALSVPSHPPYRLNHPCCSRPGSPVLSLVSPPLSWLLFPLCFPDFLMLDVSGLECVRGERCLFSGVSFRLSGGELLHVQGRNGSGKTSLLRMLCGLLPPKAGEIRWQGAPIGRLGGDFRRHVCFIGHRDAVKEILTPLENVLTTAHLAGEGLDASTARAALAQLGLAGEEETPCGRLSQGQRRRVALTRLVSARQPLWLLDEPFVALDATATTRVAALIADHLQRGGLVVLTTHQPVEIPGAALRRLALGE